MIFERGVREGLAREGDLLTNIRSLKGLSLKNPASQRSYQMCKTIQGLVSGIAIFNRRGKYPMIIGEIEKASEECKKLERVTLASVRAPALAEVKHA